MTNSFYGPLDPALDAGWRDEQPRKGFFTDTSICIGCKACEVACKEWNAVPEDGLLMLGSSYDNSGSLGASTWRHVKFIEQPKSLANQDPGLAGLPVGHTSRQAASVQCLHTSEAISQRKSGRSRPASAAASGSPLSWWPSRTGCSMNATWRHVLAPSAPVLS